MFYNAKNRSINTGKYIIDYSAFGYGDNIVVILPGIYGFTTITVKAFLLAFQFRQMAKDYRVYYFNRRKILPDYYATSEMADDQAEVMNKLGIKNAYILGFSMGGMIAQHLAINYPEKVKKLVLGVTISRPTEVLKNVVNNWIKIAKENNYKKLLINVMEKTYSEKYLRKIRRYYPLMTRIGKPSSFKHFIIEANACLTHNTYERLHQIKCQTLILGGCNDNIVGMDASKELADRIGNNELLLYEDFGHGVILEEKNCIKEIVDFFKK
jgi:pimeloyl-ACP methyl ester carboxylesterase